METMSCKDSDPGYQHPDDPLGEAIGAAAVEDCLQMFGDYDYSNGDLYELMWRGGAIATMETQPAVSCRPLSLEIITTQTLPHLTPEILPKPPSDDEMAAWLYPIVAGEARVGDPRGGDDDVAAGKQADGRPVAPAKESNKQLMEKREVLPTTGGIPAKDTSSDPRERRKTAGGARRSNYSETHNQAEKRRRCKIKDRLRTLQQLVPGCNKSNQASTLDQTIQYMKSLQQHVQAMSVGAAAAVCPVVPPPYMQPPVAVAPGMLIAADIRPGVVPAPPLMVPFAPMLSFPGHHPAMMMSAPLMYPAAASSTIAHSASSSHK